MEFRDLSEVCAWAEWAAFNRFTDVLKSKLVSVKCRMLSKANLTIILICVYPDLIIVLRERGIKFDENTIIQKRLTFVGYDRMV